MAWSSNVTQWGWLVGVLPAVWLALAFWQDDLGANPVERIVRVCGDWGLWWLLATLSISPLRHLTVWAGWSRLRRPFGLICYGYVCLHVSAYALLDRNLEWLSMVRDLQKRPYILIGFCAFLLLTPLAVTSTRSWIRRLGWYWPWLHRLIYPAAILAVWHFYRMVKADYRAVFVHFAILVVLLGWRVVARFNREAKPPSGQAA